MIKEINIDIDGAELNCSVDYDYFKSKGEVTILINHIKHGDIEVYDLVKPIHIQQIKDICELHYENYKFDEIEDLMNKTWYGMDNSQKDV